MAPQTLDAGTGPHFFLINPSPPPLPCNRLTVYLEPSARPVILVRSDELCKEAHLLIFAYNLCLLTLLFSDNMTQVNRDRDYAGSQRRITAGTVSSVPRARTASIA